MDKKQALEFIHGTQKFGSVLGLDSIKALCDKMGNPQNGQKFIHIAGTNGKGSVASALAAILTHSGYKTGLYTSPALVDFNERIRIGYAPIEDEALCREAEKVKSACDNLTAEGKAHPTEFEIVTAMGFSYFKSQQCDYTVLEVGLGGRLDATNVIDEPCLCIITSLSLDHTDRLGATIEEIAREKCGIIKGGAKVITTEEQPKGALDVIRKSSASLKAVKTPKIKKESLDGILFDYDGISDVFFPLTGAHQAQNAALAVEAARALGISDELIKEGIKETYHPARMEKASDDPLVIIDGAHNPDAMKYLKKNLETLLPDGEKTLITGMLKDKDYESALSLIVPLFDRVITVDIESPRALSKEELLKTVKKFCQNAEAMSLSEASAQIKKGGIYVVAGSLYMAGEFKKLNPQYHKVH